MPSSHVRTSRKEPLPLLSRESMESLVAAIDSHPLEPYRQMLKEHFEQMKGDILAEIARVARRNSAAKDRKTQDEILAHVDQVEDDVRLIRNFANTPNGDRVIRAWLFRMILPHLETEIRDLPTRRKVDRDLDRTNVRLVLEKLESEIRREAADEDSYRDDTIVLQADGCYRIGRFLPVRLTGTEDAVLRAFLVSPTLTLPQLKRESEHQRAHETMKELCDRYDRRFAPAIHRPGGKNRGGYNVRIRQEDARIAAAHNPAQ